MENKDTDETTERLALKKYAHYRSAIATLSEHTSRFIRIYSADLPSEIFDHNDFLEALSVFARKSQHSAVQIVVQSTLSVTQRNQHLLALHHRLSNIQIKLSDEDYYCEAETFLIFDDFALIEKPHTDREEGIAYFNAPREATRKLRQFQEVWDHAESDTNLRQQLL